VFSQKFSNTSADPRTAASITEFRFYHGQPTDCSSAAWPNRLIFTSHLCILLRWPRLRPQSRRLSTHPGTFWSRREQRRIVRVSARAGGRKRTHTSSLFMLLSKSAASSDLLHTSSHKIYKLFDGRCHSMGWEHFCLFRQGPSRYCYNGATSQYILLHSQLCSSYD